ncbi:MAG: carbohydrate kinase family protein [Candidatus Limivicinus sp.]
MTDTSAISGLRGKLSLSGDVSCFCGFDGFVDEVVHTVDSRLDAEHYTRIETLSEYGKRISGASGLSLNVEIVPVSKKLGGNGPIFALGLKNYGADITYVGAVGVNALDPVFEKLAEGSRIIGIAEPSRTDAMEFMDGKIIRSKLSSFTEVSWESILRHVGLERFVGFLDDADMISFNNWTMLPYMNGIWEHILEEAVPRMDGEKIPEKVLFFDLADPEKRLKSDICRALELIKSFKDCGFCTVLGLNKKEACEIAQVLGHTVADPRDEPLRALNEFIAEKLGLDCVTVHPLDGASCVYRGGYHYVTGPYCAKPRLTTGAGDNYNAGFVYAFLQGWNMEECLTMGTASSGYYVRNARSADRQELAGFLEKWENGSLDRDA